MNNFHPSIFCIIALLYFSLLKRINVSYENITDIIKEVPEVNNIFVRLHKFMCGNSSDVTIEKMLEPRHSVDKLVEKYQMKLWVCYIKCKENFSFRSIEF